MGRKRHHPPFRPTANGAGHVDHSGQRGAGGEDEAGQRLEGSLTLVDEPLECRHVRRRDPLGRAAGGGQLGPEVKELALDPTEGVVEVGRRRHRADQTKVAIQLIDRAKGLNPGVIFAYPRTAKETRLPLVSGLCIDLHHCCVGSMGTAELETPILAVMRETCNVILMLSLIAVPSAQAAAEDVSLEQQFLDRPVQITEGLPRAGEGYFSPDGRRIAYQAFPSGYPFYQIFVQDFDASAPGPRPPRRVSTGRGRTTCSWFSPDGRRLLFASSHLDPALDATEAKARAEAEEDARTGRRRRYQWDFDPHMDLFTARLDGTDLVRLTDTPGYDAECSFSPDGSTILFVSDRDGDPDLYRMDADGGNVRQLTNQPGYDGGPFFSPDGEWIAYRSDRLEKDLLQIHVMRADGSDDRAVTQGRGVHWAPYWHPTRPWLIWTGADHSDPTKRPNYDLWMARYVDSGKTFRNGEPLRLTDHPAADVLPSFSPDGSLLMWTASRDDGGGRKPSSQLWAAGLNLDAIESALPPVPKAGTPTP